MSVIVVGDKDHAALACNTSMAAFGPLHHAPRGRDAKEEMEEFLDFLDADPRTISDKVLRDRYTDWIMDN